MDLNMSVVRHHVRPMIYILVLFSFCLLRYLLVLWVVCVVIVIVHMKTVTICTYVICLCCILADCSSFVRLTMLAVVGRRKTIGLWCQYDQRLPSESQCQVYYPLPAWVTVPYFAPESVHLWYSIFHMWCDNHLRSSAGSSKQLVVLCCAYNIPACHGLQSFHILVVSA